MERLYSLLCALTELPGVSGAEQMSFDGVTTLCKNFFDECGTTEVGSFYGIKRSKKENAPTILFDAHLDTVGFVVREICEGGFLKVAPIGRISEKTLPASQVNIYGEKTILGVFVSTPPHLQSGDASEKKFDLSDMAIDTGMCVDELKKLVHIGSYVGLRTVNQKLCGNCCVGAGYDDRLCASVILRALEKAGDNLQNNIAVQFSGREETGYKGAMTTAYRLKPDYAVVLDVDHAYVPSAQEWRKCVKAGNGCVISYAPQTNRALTVKTAELAKSADIKVQFIAESGRTGTNSNAVQTTAGGIPVVLISVPLKNMHTASEIADLKDAMSACDVLALIMGGGLND